MSAHPTHEQLPQAYLPESFIRGLKRELDAKIKLQAELPKLIDDLSKRFAAAMVFAPPGFEPDAVTIPKAPAPSDQVQADPTIEADDAGFDLVGEPGEKIGWRRAIMEVLQSAGVGMSHQALVRVARERYALAPSSGEKAFYNAIAKLSKVGGVIKHGNLLFAYTVYEQLKATGDLPAPSPVARRSGSSAEIVISVLSSPEHARGLTGPELRKALSKIPETPKSLIEHGQYIYNVLATIIGTGEVVKENGVYRLASKETERAL